MRTGWLQQLLDSLRRVLRPEVVVDLLPDFGVGTEPAAGEQVIALDGVVILADRHFGADQADIADVRLRAGMMAAGEMNIQRSVDRPPRLAPVPDRGGVAFGVGRRKFAAGIAGAGDQSGANLRRRGLEAHRFDRRNRKYHILVAHARDQQVLPNRQPDVAVAEILRDLPQSPHPLTRYFAERQYETDPVQSRLLLLVDADMCHAVECRARREGIRWNAGKGGSGFFL